MKASKICANIVKNVDKVNDNGVSTRFGDMCDKIKECAVKIIYSYQYVKQG